MKVKMGKYSKRVYLSVFDWYVKCKYGDEQYDYDPKNGFEQFVWNVDDIIFRILRPVNVFKDKFFNGRKIKIKVHDYDVWNADYTMAELIYHVLLKYKDDPNAFLTVDKVDAPEGMKRQQRYEYVIDEMIWTFDCLRTGDYMDQYIVDEVEDESAFMGIRVNLDKDKMDEIEQRIENGLRLFGKYFRALWT